jgi:hypothetical protein
MATGGIQMTNDEISAAISENLEPFIALPDASSGDSNSQITVLAWKRNLGLARGRDKSEWNWIPTDWLEGENCMRLFDVMPQPRLLKVDDAHWKCEANAGDGHSEISNSRQQAIRNAYCAWKGIPFKGPDPDAHLGHEGSE